MGLILIKFLELTIIVISLERLKLAVESWVGREMEERKLKSQFRWELIHGIKLWGFFPFYLCPKLLLLTSPCLPP